MQDREVLDHHCLRLEVRLLELLQLGVFHLCDAFSSAVVARQTDQENALVEEVDELCGVDKVPLAGGAVGGVVLTGRRRMLVLHA